MKLVEQHIIKSNDQRYKGLCIILSNAKNLYNSTLYVIRQHYFHLTGKQYTEDIAADNEYSYINYYEMNKIMKHNKCYASLPANTSQEVLKQVDKNFKSFFALIKLYQNGKLEDAPSIPKYKKQNALYPIVYNKMTFCSQKSYISSGEFYLPLNKQLKFKIKNYKTCSQIRFIPKNNYIIMEAVYEKQEKELLVDNQKYMAIDLGINNLASCSSNSCECFIINGKPIKSINQFYNKNKAELQSRYAQCKQNKTSKRIHKLSLKRRNKIYNYFHEASKFIIYQCVENDIHTLIIGKNNEWKDESNIGKVNNQNFISIPHNLLIQMLQYKGKLQGINVVLQEESYTSKCSFFDNDYIPTYGIDDNMFKPTGKRIKRGLYKTSTGYKFNADINGSLNILRKYLNVVSEQINLEGYRGSVVNPVKYSFGKQNII